MREIKFKAYDTQAKVWIENINTWEVQYLHKDNISEVIKVMQYTGLKDKNGVEIYEGDIVKSKASENDVFTIDMSNLDWFISPKGHAFDNNSIDFEVIGNIYENKDLIK